MSRRKTHSPGGSTLPGVRAEHFPVFTAFARGYLHQDYAAEHGSAEDAARAFCADAGSAECRRLLVELEVLVRLLADRPAAARRQIVTGELRSAWVPDRKDAMRRLLDVVREQSGRPPLPPPGGDE